ncbi:Sterigmatocystin 8-O-methyltransferase protein [Rutstroemia sp. NJR-2017a WRK4]|nr:Sterigmatocystin 8-O-methyltransferase protein [Rutstroemia sp. NJR-2017a WRK4]
MTSPNNIVTLATTISKTTATINAYLTAHGLPIPSFDVSGPSRFSIPPEEKEVVKAHAELLRATMELHNLMLGPTAMLMGISPMDNLSLHCIYAFKMAHTFPVASEASFEDISAACGLNVIDTRRILRHAMTNHIFQEVRPGTVVHTAASKLLATDPLVSDFVGIGCEERFQAATYTVEALKRFGYAEEPNQSGFSLGHQTTRGLYDELRANPTRGERWANAMSIYASRIPLSPLIDSYDWANLSSAKILDVGGGYGPVSIGLAKAFPSLAFVVQDFADVIEDGPSHVPAETSSRITFMAYDMLTPQTVRDADVVFFRAVLHNWTDHYCLKILRNQIPALKKGSRLVIVEPQLPEPGKLSWHAEKRLRTMDLNMLSYFGSRERSVADWEDIFKRADERFVLKKAVDLADGLNCIMEVLWNEE